MKPGDSLKDLLVVAYSFPPCSVTGTFRTLAFVKYLEPNGWRATVLSAENAVHPERDERLLQQIPASATTIRTRDIDPLAWWSRVRPRGQQVQSTGGSARRSWSPLAPLKRSIVRRLHPFNRRPGWYLSTLRAGREVLRGSRPSAIYSSGPPWTAHLVARRLAREFDLPWIADFRDPWVSNPFAPDDPALRRRDLRDEARVLTDADMVVSVLETMRDDFLRRYPGRRPESVVTIPNGFDPATLGPQILQMKTDAQPVEAGRLTLLHAGQIYGRRRIEPLVAGLRDWIRAEPAMADQVRLHLLGGNAEHAEEQLAKIRALGADRWTKVEVEVPHAEAVQRSARATVLVLIGFSGVGEQYQMSGKIFEYLALRRPILALAPPESPVGTVLRQTGVRHWIVSPDDAAGLQAALREIALDWRAGKLDGPQGNGSLTAYDRREQAGRLAELIERGIVLKAGGAPKLES